MTSHEDNQIVPIASFDSIKYLDNLMNFEDVNMNNLFSEEEIQKFVSEQGGSEEARNLLLELSKTPTTIDIPKKKKEYYYEFPNKELEAYYKICTHPNETERKALASDLGIHQLQVMFWFKNKRKQMKDKFEHSPNCQIHTKNEILKQIKFKESLCSCTCDQCGAVTSIPAEHQLRKENERLKKEYAKLLSTVRKFGFAEK